MSRWTLTCAAALGVVVGMYGSARPAADPAAKCVSAKVKATGKHAAADLKCHSKAVQKGIAVDGECLAKSEGKFGDAFVKAEGKGSCPATGDIGPIRNLSNSFVTAGVAALPAGTTPEAAKCAAAKIKATGGKADGKLSCHAKAIGKSVGVDAGCLSKAEEKFMAAFDKAEGKGSCATVQDAGTLEALVDGFVTSVVDGAQPSTTTSTTTTTQAPGTTTSTSSSTTTSTAVATTTSTTLGGAICGNGIREGAEQCDDANDLNTDGCTNACKNARCGDGITWQGVEDCDDANVNNADACLNTCRWAPAICGDGIRQFGESCDDGNRVDGDTCPASCLIADCTPSTARTTVSVTYTKPASVTVGGIQVFVDYPEGKAAIPGLGNASSVRARILNLPTGFTSQPNDLEYALREILVASTTGTTLNPAAAIFRIQFDGCFGQVAPTAGEFTCRVEAASTPQGQDVNLTTNPMTCTVTIP